MSHVTLARTPTIFIVFLLYFHYTLLYLFNRIFFWFYAELREEVVAYLDYREKDGYDQCVVDVYLQPEEVCCSVLQRVRVAVCCGVLLMFTCRVLQ